jgi:hypothetical protein
MGAIFNRFLIVFSVLSVAFVSLYLVHHFQLVKSDSSPVSKVPIKKVSEAEYQARLNAWTKMENETLIGRK